MQNKPFGDKKVTTEDKPVVAKSQPQVYNYKQVQSMIEARLIYFGNITGTRYEWPTAGTVISVRVEDIPNLLEQTVGKSDCCGGGKGNFSLQLV